MSTPVKPKMDDVSLLSGFLSALSSLLPKIKTRLQLFGIVVALGAWVIVHTIAPTAIKAQISAGAIGIAFIIFGQVFAALREFPEAHRARLIISLFVVFCVFVLALIVVTSYWTVTATEVEWTTFLNNYGRESDGTWWTVTSLSPSRTIATPMKLELEFSQPILGDPIIQQLTPSGTPETISVSVIRRSANKFMVTISDPPQTPLFVKTRSNSPPMVTVRCLTCPSE